jgi:tetratricopeptide (TPR) repeat protein
MNTSARPPAHRRRAVSSRAASAAVHGTASGHERWVWLVPALVVLALYARTLGYAFVWDDLDLIVRHAALHGADWTRLLAQDFWQATGGGTGMWRPLVTLSDRVDGVLSGWQPWAFHLVNTLAFAAACAVLAKLARARGLPAWAALGAGLVYATAPALTESTAWVAGRTDAFASLFTLAALLLARDARARRSRTRDGAALACVALALLAKESALVLPLLIAADAADGAAPGDRPAWRAALPSLVVVLLWAAVHRVLVPGVARPATPGAAAGMAALVWTTLAWLAPWAPHSPLLELWHAPPGGIAMAAWLALAAVAALTAWLVRRRAPLALAVALVFAPLLPVAAAALLEPGVRFAERALALPAAGMALALAWLVGQAPASRRLVANLALGAWLALQISATWPAIGAWRDEESRLRRIAQVRPRDTDALLGLSDLLSTQGRDAEALAWIARAEAIAPAEAGPLVARASLEFRSGKPERALAAADAALGREPGDLAAGVLRVRALARLGRAPEAVASGERLLAAHPGEAAAQGALGAARFAAGDAASALEPLRAASERLLDDAGLAWDLGRAAIARGDVALARTAFERAVVAAPAFYEAWLGVADTRARLGDAAGAEQALARAAALPGASDGRVQALREHLRAR